MNRWIRVAALVGVAFIASVPARASENNERIQPYKENPFYWQYKGEPVLLLGGSWQDNLFNHPTGLAEHLDLLVASGGNYVRNTMSHRNVGNVFAYEQVDGKFDLDRWNEEYWRRLDDFLRMTYERDIIVQIEVFDPWDHFVDHQSLGGWSKHPFNPINNVTYTAEQSGLPTAIDYSPGPRPSTHAYWLTVPALQNNGLILGCQQAYVDKMLSISLQYPHVLYCIQNESGEELAFGEYWADHIHRRARQADRTVFVTDMRRNNDITAADHASIYARPDRYCFVDISQNNSQNIPIGQLHWDRIRAVRALLREQGVRPMNNIKIYSREHGEQEIVMVTKYRILIAAMALQWAAVMVKSGTARTEPEEPTSLDRTGTLWTPCLEWSLKNPTWEGNPFDVMATATFEHADSGETRTTGMFYDGDNTWKFRFTGTRTGLWRLRTSSDDPDLDGKRGTVTIESNPDPNAKGFIVAHKNKFAWQIGQDGTLEAFVPNIYMNFVKWGVPERCGWTAVTPTFSDAETFAAYLDEAESHGCNGVFARMGNQWFKAQAVSYRDHDSENPDPETFRAMEDAIAQAHRRGMFLHIWVWGDEQRRWTPVGVSGGINGQADRRMQRYMAARLGPVPGWTMNYGSDLNEWVQPEQVAEWADYLCHHSGWNLMLSARETADGRGFRSPDTLPVAANDDGPAHGRFDRQWSFYHQARKRLSQEPQRPVRFEQRFSYLRNQFWDMDRTRRAFWQFALAGGAASIWGHYPAEGNCSARFEGDYPHSEQLRTHRTFWQQRFLLDMEPANDLGGDDDTLVLASGDGRAVYYREDAQSIQINLAGPDNPQRVVAVDTLREYREIDLPRLARGSHTIDLPHRSDWAIAVGF